MKTILFFTSCLFIASIATGQYDDTLKPYYLYDYQHYEYAYLLFTEGELHPMPCELYSFEYQSNENTSKLSWVTLSESNTSYFTVEILDNGSWEHIDETMAQGNSNSPHEYQITLDEKLASGTLIRLMLHDHDGSISEVSRTMAQEATVETNTLSDFHIASDAGTITLLWNCLYDNTDLHICIYNMSGQMVFSQGKKSEEGINFISDIRLKEGQSYIAIVESANARLSYRFGL